MQICLQKIVPSFFSKQDYTDSEVWDKSVIFNKGENVHIVAPSGSGKTSLIDFLLLDEPFSHLDDSNTKKAMALIEEEAAARNAAILLNDLRKIDHLKAEKILYL